MDAVCVAKLKARAEFGRLTACTASLLVRGADDDALATHVSAT
jgi:hypothetical protein